MCKIYINSDTALFELKTRSIRIDGLVTSIRLELIFWQLLDRISEEENLKLSEFLSKIYYEGLVKRGSIANFSSALRVACTAYLNNKEHVKFNSDCHDPAAEILSWQLVSNK
ncbi:MAG: ribbon-helix-helix domain-containing protein [Colwellia sp.]